MTPLTAPLSISGPAPLRAVLGRDAIDATVVSVNWNGAADVAVWRVLAGRSPDALEEAAQAPKTGFEMAIDLPVATT